MSELGVREYRRGKTHGTGVGIALQPTITTAVEAAVHSSGRGKVTVSATLKTTKKKRACAPTKVRERMQPGTGGEGVGEKGENANPYTARFPVIWD
jgi:hypothetical protein